MSLGRVGHLRVRPRRLPTPGALVKQVFLLLAAAIVLLPTIFVLFTAFKTAANYSVDKLGPPVSLYLGNLETAMRGGLFFQWFLNSVILTVGSGALTLVVCVPAALAFSRMRFPFQNLLFALVTSLMVLPPVVLVLPLFLLLTSIGLVATYPGAIVVYAGLCTPFSVYLLVSFFRAIPVEIIEAATLDGANTSAILLRVVVPLARPALATLLIVNAVWVWNDLLIPLILLPKDDLRTLMVGVTIFGTRYNSDVPVSMAGMLVASLPMLLLYIVGQRYLIRGLTAGALKG